MVGYSIAWVRLRENDGSFRTDENVAILPDRTKLNSDYAYGQRRYDLSQIEQMMKSAHQRLRITDLRYAIVSRIIDSYREIESLKEKKEWHYNSQ